MTHCIGDNAMTICIIEAGYLATIPPKIRTDIPFPIPFSVILSPSHRRNIVPPIRVAVARRTKRILLGMAIIAVFEERPNEIRNP